MKQKNNADLATGNSPWKYLVIPQMRSMLLLCPSNYLLPSTSPLHTRLLRKHQLRIFLCYKTRRNLESILLLARLQGSYPIPTVFTHSSTAGNLVKGSPIQQASFSTKQKLGRWQGGHPGSECQKPGNQPFFLLHISLSPAPLHPSPLPFPAGRHSAYLCISWLLVCLDPSRKSAKRPLNKIPSELPPGLGNSDHTEQSTHVPWATNLAGRVSPVMQLWQQSLGALGLSHTLQCNSCLASCCHGRGWK